MHMPTLAHLREKSNKKPLERNPKGVERGRCVGRNGGGEGGRWVVAATVIRYRDIRDILTNRHLDRQQLSRQEVR